MWSTALLVASVIWALLGVFVVYSGGTLVLFGAWHQLLLSIVLWTFSTLAVVIFAIVA